MKRHQSNPWRGQAKARLTVGLVVFGLLAVGCTSSGESSSTDPTEQREGAEGPGATSATGGLPAPDAPWWGVVLDRSPEGLATEAQIEQMQDLGVDYAKFWVPWDDTEPELVSYNMSSDDFGIAGEDQPTDLTRELVAENEEWIEDYAFPERRGSRFSDLVDWSRLDAQVDQLVAAEISPLPLIGDAPSAPRLSGGEGDPTAAPEPVGFRGQVGDRPYAGIGPEGYLAHAELYAAAAARRYSDAPQRVTWWNLENELNFANYHVTLQGWRTGEAWLDDEFRLEVLATLSRGIKRGSTNAMATHNVGLHDPDWADDLPRYSEHLDAIGLGAYPNYASPAPPRPDILVDAVETAVALGEDLDKPVFVLESGYPSGPTSGGWDDKLQAEYVSAAAAGSREAGATGYIHFLLNDRDWDFPEGELQQVENHWGLVWLDGTYKDSFTIFRDIIAS